MHDALARKFLMKYEEILAPPENSKLFSEIPKSVEKNNRMGK